MDNPLQKLLPFPAPASNNGAVPATPPDPYHSGMTAHFNALHDMLYRQLFAHIQIDPASVAQLQALAQTGTVIYATPHIGQLEYHLFNDLFVSHHLPLARHATGLTTTAWRPWREEWRSLAERAWRVVRRNPLPHPVRSGLVQQLVTDGHSVLVRVRTSQLYDDLYWDDPAEDPLQAVVQAQARSPRPMYIVPLQCIWDRRPDNATQSLLDVIFGDRHQPRLLRKLWLFVRNYKNTMQLRIGVPIELTAFLAEASPPTEPRDSARRLRNQLLGVLQRERKGITGPSLKPRDFLIDQTIADAHTQRTLYDVAREHHRPVEDLHHLAKKYAREIAANMSHFALEIVYRLCRWAFRNIYSGVTLNLDGLEVARRALENGSLVLVPSHRSHVDYLLLSVMFYEHNVAVPYVASGINLAFWPFGAIARRCGAFFLRRSFGGNRLYRAVFESYLRGLLRDGHCIEFFIEGGRSRTGKSLMPRLGMLSMLNQSLREGVVNDLTFMPVSITYDRVIEQGSYLSEIAGGQKSRESFRDMLSIGKYLKRRYGRIYVQFGAPLQFSEVLCDTAGHAMTPAEITDDFKPQVTQALATRLMREINKGIVVTPAALTATALLITHRNAVTHAELTTHTERLYHYLQWREAPASDLLQKDLPRAVREAAQHFAHGHLVELHDDFAPVCYQINREKRASLDLSKNTIVHYFVSISCLAVILRSHYKDGQTLITKDSLISDYLLCRQLFAHEFRFATRFAPELHLDRHVRYLESIGGVQHPDDPAGIAVDMAGADRLRLFAHILRNYFESYKAAFLACEQIPASGLEERALVRHMMDYARHLLLLGAIRSPEAVSQINFKNAITAFRDLGLLKVSDKTFQFSTENPAAATFKQKLERWS